jgi:hypothetical protein
MVNGSAVAGEQRSDTQERGGSLAPVAAMERGPDLYRLKLKWRQAVLGSCYGSEKSRASRQL